MKVKAWKVQFPHKTVASTKVGVEGAWSGKKRWFWRYNISDEKNPP